MDIRHLSYFLEVARQKSFTRAGEVLHITQPTISKMVRNLEEELDVTLLDRSGKSIELTDAGKVLQAQAQDIVKSFENLSAELADVVHIQRGSIKIGLPPMVGTHFFPRVLAEFHRRYPKVTIQLIEVGAKKIEHDIENRELDLGVVLEPVDHSKFNSFTFYEETLILVVHPDNPLAGSKSVCFQDLHDQPFILFREDFTLHDAIIQECTRAGFTPHVVYESSQWDFIAQMVAANLGVALLPQTVCRGLDRSGVTVVPVTHPAIPWHLAMIWNKDKYLSFAARAWLEVTRNFLKPA